MIKKLLFFSLCFLQVSCGFHLQGETKLALPLQRLYLQTSDPYSHFAHTLKQYLKLSHVQLVDSPDKATTILAILQDAEVQDLLSVGGTQQTRQYILKVILVFELRNNQGRPLAPAQTLVESRVITVQSNQILGSSNEVNLYYQQLHRAIAYALMNRIASHEITQLIDSAFSK